MIFHDLQWRIPLPGIKKTLRKFCVAVTATQNHATEIIVEQSSPCSKIIFT